MAVTSRTTLAEYALRKLGAPVIEINIDPDQIEDRIDEALERYRDFHYDGTVRMFLKHQLTATDITNGYIPMSADIPYITRVFSPGSGVGATSGMFSVQYQMMLNDMAFMGSWAGASMDLSYYTQTKMYLETIDMTLNGTPQLTFARRQGRLYIHGDDLGIDLKEGNWIVVEVLEAVDPDTHSLVWNDGWLKKYTAALFKKQWASNLIKFEGMQLPGGVTLNTRMIYEDAVQEIEKLNEDLRLTYELPPDFLVG